MFGRFECSECGNEWFSAGAWKNYYQQCKDCGEEVMTWNLWFLRSGGGGGNLSHGHYKEYCEKCKELGRNCLNR